jgi:hypothetical protein
MPPSPAIDTSILEWIDGRIKETKEAIENRLSEDRAFIKDVLGLAAKVCGVSIILIFGVIGFFGYKDISSIDDKINKSVNEKIKEKSDEFSRIYEKDIQSLADQALIAAYSIQFSAPHKRFDKPTILPTHLQRFVQILSDQNSEQKVLSQLYELLSDPTRDASAPLVNAKLAEMVSGSGAYAWIKGDTGRLSGIIDLLRDRNWKSDPARIRSYLGNDTSAPEVRKSAALFAERAHDEAAIPILVRMLRSTSTPNPDIFFALVSLSPRDQWVTDWTKALAQSPAEAKSSPDFRDKLILTLRVWGPIFASFTSFAHFSISSRCSAVNCSGMPGNASAPAV